MKKAVLFLFLAVFITSPVYAESLTLTTYYPAPFGAYDRLRLVPREEAIEDPCQSGMFYVKQDGFTPNVTATLRFCMDDGQGVGEGTFRLLRVWTQDESDDVYLTDTTNLDLKVGIGTTTPAQKLDVQGQIHASGDICTDQGGGVCLSNDGSNCPADKAAGGVDANGNAEECVSVGGGGHGDGWNCPPGQAARGVDADGRAQDCTTIPSAAVCTWDNTTYTTGAQCYIYFGSDNKYSNECGNAYKYFIYDRYTCNSNGSWSAPTRVKECNGIRSSFYCGN